MPDITDWRVVTAVFQRMFGDRLFHETLTNPRPFFGRGPNLMTDEILGDVIAADGTVVEISTGMFLGDRIFGVTFPRINDGTDAGAANDRSQMVRSLAEIADVIDAVPNPDDEIAEEA